MKKLINNAITYYTKDIDDWRADNYKWIKANADISKFNKTITPELPDDAFHKCGYRWRRNV